MLARPTLPVLRALAGLRGHGAWDTVLAYLTEERAKVLEALAESPDPAALQRLQGRAMVLKEVLELAAKPDALLTKLEAPKRLSDQFV